MRKGIRNKKQGVTIGIDYMDRLKKPCLVVEVGNTETKYASFNNEHSADEFMKILTRFAGIKEETDDEQEIQA